MSKFKIGDEVRVISDIDSGIWKGRLGKIKVPPDYHATLNMLHAIHETLYLQFL